MTTLPVATRIHASLDTALARKRLVFWYDPSSEWDDAFKSYAGKGVEKLRVEGEVAGHADLTAATFSQHVLIEPGPVLDRLVAGGLQTGEGDRHHDDSCGRTPVLAGGRFAKRSIPSSEPWLPRMARIAISSIHHCG
jgi:hypothetical protein